MSNRELAKITSTFLGIEDHGILTAYLYVDYEGGSSQGIGGYALDEPQRDADDKFLGRFGTAEGMQWVAAVIRVTGAKSWEDVHGRMIYVIRDGDNKWNGKPIGIQALGFGGESEPFMFGSIWPQDTPTG